MVVYDLFPCIPVLFYIYIKAVNVNALTLAINLETLLRYFFFLTQINHITKSDHNFLP